MSQSEYTNKTCWVSSWLVFIFIVNNTLSNTMHTIQNNHNMHWRQSCMHFCNNIQQCHMVSRFSTHKKSKKHSWIVTVTSDESVHGVIRIIVRPTHLMSLREALTVSFFDQELTKKQRRQRWSAKLMSPELFDHSIFNEMHTMPTLKTLQMTP